MDKDYEPIPFRENTHDQQPYEKMDTLTRGQANFTHQISKKKKKSL